MHETSVLGTYISGKYAQVLQSTSHIYNGNGNRPKIAPSQSLRVLKTAAPHIPRKTHVVEAKQQQQQSSASVETEEVDEIYGNLPRQNLVRNSRRPAVSSNTFKNRFRNQNRASSAQRDDTDYTDGSSSASVEVTTPAAVTPSSYKKSRNTNKSPKRYTYLKMLINSHNSHVNFCLLEPKKKINKLIHFLLNFFFIAD